MKKPHIKKRIVCGAAAILITGLSSTVFVSAEPRPLESRAAVPAKSAMNKVAMTVDAATIERGRYLMKTAGCNDCHTPGYAATGGAVEEKQWLTGDVVGWQGAWGTTYPINLRLFMQNLTAEQWLKVARTPARPPMPWFALRDMTDQDLLAVYHYVRSLGAAGSAAPAYVPPGTPTKGPVVQFPASPPAGFP